MMYKIFRRKRSKSIDVLEMIVFFIFLSSIGFLIIFAIISIIENALAITIRPEIIMLFAGLVFFISLFILILCSNIPFSFHYRFIVAEEEFLIELNDTQCYCISRYFSIICEENYLIIEDNRGTILKLSYGKKVLEFLKSIQKCE